MSDKTAHKSSSVLVNREKYDAMVTKIAELEALQADSAAVAVDIPDDVRQAIRYCWRWALLHAETLVDEERYRFVNGEIDKVVVWLQEPGSIVAGWQDSAAAPQPPYGTGLSEWMPVEHELYEYPDGKRGLVYANSDGMGRPQLRYYRDADTDTPTETVIILPEHLRLCKRVAAPQPVAPSPNWENAPAWAMWWAIDADNDAFWYESEPQPRFDHWMPPSDTRYEKDDRDDGAWRQTLQRRPEAP